MENLAPLGCTEVQKTFAAKKFALKLTLSEVHKSCELAMDI
jgi:hypothetical protein